VSNSNRSSKASQPIRIVGAEDYSAGRWMTRCVKCAASVCQLHHLLLTRPCDRCIEQAGDTDSARQPTIDSGLDEAWGEERQRYRHADVALATGLPRGDAVDRRGTGFDFGQPLPSPYDRSDELNPGIGADREDCGW
jgi:hypothetical protein